MTWYIGYCCCCDIPELNSLMLHFIWATQIIFLGIPLTKDIFNSIIGHNAHIKDLLVQFVLFKLLCLFLYCTGMQTAKQHLNIIMCIKLHLNVLKCFKKISHKLVHTIHLSHLHLLHFLHAGCAHLKCSSPSPSSALFILRFLLPWPFFLSKRDFG